MTFAKSGSKYPITQIQVDERNNIVPASLKTGRRVVTNVPSQVAAVLYTLASAPNDFCKDVVIDDANYLMQDWYMDNALATGWDSPKKIGYFMGQIFKAFEALDKAGKNIYMLAHGENVQQPDGRTYTKFKTTGKMVDDYLTPEGKFDVTLLGVSSFDASEKKVKKEYITRETEFYSSPKSPYGMFETERIPNDLAIVKQAVESYYG